MILICDEASPLEVQPRIMAETIFQNDEVYRDSREALERQRNEQRLMRLMELGAISSPHDPILDWATVEEEDQDL